MKPETGHLPKDTKARDGSGRNQEPQASCGQPPTSFHVSGLQTSTWFTFRCFPKKIFMELGQKNSRVHTKHLPSWPCCCSDQTYNFVFISNDLVLTKAFIHPLMKIFRCLLNLGSRCQVWDILVKNQGQGPYFIKLVLL